MENKEHFETQQFRLSLEVRYATETNTAFQLAINFCRIFQKYISSFKQIGCQENSQQQLNLQKYDCNEHKNKRTVYIFFIATTGYGDPPYMMRPTWKKLLSKAFNNYSSETKVKPLQGMKFAIYGLGDRSYGDNYNLSARKFRQRMLMLGAVQIFEIVLGDEQDRAGNYHQFSVSFVPALQQYIDENSLKSSKIETNNQKLDSQIENNFDFIKLTSRKKIEDKLNKFQLISSKLLSSINNRQIHWVSLQYTVQKQIDVVIGDTLNIYPQNPESKVLKLIQYFINNNLNDINLSQEQLYWYLKNVANIQNTVNYEFFSGDNTVKSPNKKLFNFISLSHKKESTAPDKIMEINSLLKQKLEELSSDYNEYYNYIIKYKRNVQEVLIDFDLKIPLSEFIRRVGTIIPRKYSVAQVRSVKEGENVLEICLLIKLEKHETIGNRVVNGLCSHDLILSSLSQKESYRKGSILKSGEFQYVDAKCPIAIISMGTGIAPFLAIMLQAYDKLKSQQFCSKQQEYPIIFSFQSYRYRQQHPFIEIQDELCSKYQIMEQWVSYTRQESLEKSFQQKFIHKKNGIRIQNMIEHPQALKKIQKNVLDRKGRVMICGGKQFVQVILRKLRDGLGVDTNKLRKAKAIKIEYW